MFNFFWNYKVQLAPILATFLLFEIPTLIRRWKRVYYIPIYFVFPLNEISNDLATYFGEDYTADKVAALPPKEKEALSVKIVTTSVASMILAALVTPVFAGFFSAFFLTSSQLGPFIVLLLLYKAKNIIYSLFDLRENDVAISKKIGWFVLIYTTYLAVAAYSFASSYLWARPYLESHNWGGLLSDLSALIIGKIIINTLLVALVTGAATAAVLSRRVKDEKNKEGAKTPSQT